MNTESLSRGWRGVDHDPEATPFVHFTRKEQHMTASETLAAPAPSRGRAANVTLWVLQVLLAAFFAFAGINKLLGLQQEMVDNFAKIGLGVWFRYLVGTLELAGAIGLLIPRLSGLAALGLAGVMIGAVLTHLLVLPPMYYASGPAVLVVVFGLIAWGRWPQTKALLGKLRG
jgi:putative oxidoreductase